MKKSKEKDSLKHTLHEVNNILTTILLSAELLSSELDKKEQKSLKDIINEVKKVCQILKEIEI